MRELKKLHSILDVENMDNSEKTILAYFIFMMNQIKGDGNSIDMVLQYLQKLYYELDLVEEDELLLKDDIIFTEKYDLGTDFDKKEVKIHLNQDDENHDFTYLIYSYFTNKYS